ncbi:hypothetical protein SAMN05428642_103442 [Flaviramulus basaltis]|uniref:DUF4398 domain-containing protein n=1 Tax=Flaviramulus basaltis TaxID=369401 RepID=A0A1K2INR7_9FLAO|nr:hypothetical protein [Flaviramulus basaltis]SFZ93942.1 hypothetical protein SAMN05428642_103442 [Flaviramulus basaltis]
MKNFFLFFALLASLIINAQSNCDDANSYIVNAYSHVKDAYEANNISHLKYFANRSLESYKLSKKSLKDCGCKTALELADKSIELLAKVEGVETYEDGRFYVKRARDVSKECIIEIDKCAVETDNIDVTENTTLNDLQNEQLKLKQQQDALKQKEEEIKMQMAQQKEKELTLKKEQLIFSYKSAIVLNIKTYNESLKICDCNHEIIKDNENTENLSIESVEYIKNHYNNSLKTLASGYLAELNSCNK